MSRILVPVLFAAAILSISGCATQPQIAAKPQREGGNATTRLMIAEIALQRGDYPAAAREYSNAAYLATDKKLAEQATRVAFENRQDNWAVQSARRWLELDPQSDDARRYIAVVALRLFQVEEASRQFRHLVEKAYETPAKAFIDLSTTLADEDNAYAVFLLMQGLAARYPQLPEAHYAVGMAALRAYSYERAITNARRALELNPRFVEAERLLARALLVGGDPTAALKLARMRAAASNDPQDRLEVGLLLAASGANDEARTELATLLDNTATKADALRTLANIDLSQGKLEDASRRFTELLTTGRYVSLAFYSLGSIHERQREAVRAIRYYTRVTGGPYASECQLRAARLLVANGARDEANQLLDNFVGENPDRHVEIAIGRARMLADEGDTRAALEVLDSARRLYPDIQELRYARSTTLEQAGKVNETIAELRAALASRPEDPTALNALGYTLAEHKRTLNEAASLVQRALEKTPDNPAVQDTHGWVLHRQGKDAEALKWLETAYASQQDAEIAAHIGEVYWAMGQRGKAREVWQAALTVDPNHRYLLRTLRRYPD